MQNDEGLVQILIMVLVSSEISEIAGRLIGFLNAPDFPEKLDCELRGFVDFDLTAVIGFPIGEKPVLLHDGLGQISSPLVMDTYLNKTFVLDACYVACAKGVEDGLYRLSELAPDDFFQTNYYNSPEVHPCISLESGSLAEEIVYITQPTSGYYLCYSLMRSSQLPIFAAEEFARLKQMTPVVFSLLAKHWASFYAEKRKIVQPELRNTLDIAFASFRKEALSPREQLIVSLILRGHSSFSVAQVLGIAEGTVKNHRKHIHSKLGITSQSELFNQFLEHLTSRA